MLSNVLTMNFLSVFSMNLYHIQVFNAPVGYTWKCPYEHFPLFYSDNSSNLQVILSR